LARDGADVRVGHSRRFWHVRGTSAYPPLATDVRTFRIGSFVPGGDIAPTYPRAILPAELGRRTLIKCRDLKACRGNQPTPFVTSDDPARTRVGDELWDIGPAAVVRPSDRNDCAPSSPFISCAAGWPCAEPKYGIPVRNSWRYSVHKSSGTGIPTGPGGTKPD